MIGQTLSMFSAMYDAIGPGVFLAATFPFFLAALVVMVRQGLRRRSHG
jgi:hypothetical protein